MSEVITRWAMGFSIAFFYVLFPSLFILYSGNCGIIGQNSLQVPPMLDFEYAKVWPNGGQMAKVLAIWPKKSR